MCVAQITCLVYIINTTIVMYTWLFTCISDILHVHLGVSVYSTSTETHLHWLPVNWRIRCKLSTLATHQPPYLASLLHFPTDRPPHSSFIFPELNWTWASVLSLLLHPTFGRNSQQCCENVASFRKNLITYCVKIAFPT